LGFWFLFFTFVFQSAAVPGRWNSNSTPAQSAIVGSKNFVLKTLLKLKFLKN
jgi:hypothetical protein